MIRLLGIKNKIAVATLIGREFRRIMRIWSQTLLPPVITVSLYFIIFGKLIGSKIGHISGISYIEYIVPGLVMMSVVTNAYSNVCSSFYSAKYQHFVEEILVSPVSSNEIIIGYISGGMLRGILVGLIVIWVSLYFIDLRIHSYPITFAVAFFTAALFSLAGMINSLYASNFDEVMLIPTFVLTPLTYLGGVFYSIDLLPPIWQKVTHLNPIFYIVNAFRYGMIGQSDVNWLHALVVIFLITASLYGICLYLLTKGIGIKN